MPVLPNRDVSPESVGGLTDHGIPLPPYQAGSVKLRRSAAERTR